MRVLFAFAGGSGHLNPLVPIAEAASAARHTVAVAGRAAMRASVEAAGFTHFATGGDHTRPGPPTRSPLRPPDPARERREFREGFAGRMAAQRAEGVLERCRRWRPDVVVCDEADFGAMLAAERLGVPHATVLLVAAGAFERPESLATRLDEVRAGLGLPADPAVRMPARYLVLSPCPPGYRDPAHPLPDTAYPIRPRVGRTGSRPAWLPDLPGVPVVYLTLGTVFNMASGDLFERALAGLRDLPVTLVVTVGQHIDPADFGRQPDNVHIHRYVPQDRLLPHCDVVVSHGGSGSVVGALAHGVPLVLLPMGADQPMNAARCQRLGVGRVLDPASATPGHLRDAVSHVLGDPSYRHAARRLGAECARLPGPGFAVGLLERLAAERRPLPSRTGAVPTENRLP